MLQNEQILSLLPIYTNTSLPHGNCLSPDYNCYPNKLRTLLTNALYYSYKNCNNTCITPMQPLPALLWILAQCHPPFLTQHMSYESQHLLLRAGNSCDKTLHYLVAVFLELQGTFAMCLGPSFNIMIHNICKVMFKDEIFTSIQIGCNLVQNSSTDLQTLKILSSNNTLPIGAFTNPSLFCVCRDQ